MAYIRRDYYVGLYGEIPDTDFTRLSWEAERYVDLHTTGIDNVRKLKKYFPQEEEDAELVKRCVAKLTNFLHQIHKAETEALSVAGYEATEQGVRGKVVTHITAGNESITYAAGANTATAIDAAVKDKRTRDRMAAEIIWEYLAGVEDANGVNLLYMGRYPRV